jgi:DNA-directed RNA polymerase subunit beta'
MLSTHNMLSPASGDPLVAPTLDMVMGCYYLTQIREGAKGEGRRFFDFDEARIAHASGLIDLQASIWVRHIEGFEGLNDEEFYSEGPEEERPEEEGRDEDEWVQTTLGRLMFNEIVPPSIGFRNRLMDRGGLKDLTADLYRYLSNEETAEVLDEIKDLGFHYATTSGITIAINDIQVSAKKPGILNEAAQLVSDYEEQYLSGLISEDERYARTVDAWTRASDQTTALVEEELSNYGGIAMMAVSGAKGNISQIKQMAGMRGLMSNPKGWIIDLPIKSSFREGLTALEYFISTHGARKGLADTALRTADSGYLTRRLIDIAQEVIVLEGDCGTFDTHWVADRAEDKMQRTLKERVLGRLAAEPIGHPETGEIMVDRNDEINEAVADSLIAAGITEIPVRSPLTCEARRGVCKMCYGRLPATGVLVEEGQAVGIIAAQSIGEPGTQLTMRTFHTGGVAGLDITTGLPRVEELFEARVPKGAAILADIDSTVEIDADEEGRRLKLVSREELREEYEIPEDAQVLVDHGEYVEPGMVLASPLPILAGYDETGADGTAENGTGGNGASEQELPQPIQQVVANIAGRVELDQGGISIVWEDVEEREHMIPASAHILVASGDSVKAGDALINGPLNPHDILHIRGKDDLQLYLVNEVQQVYQSQGVSIHDKHIEIILRQMLRRVSVESTGDSDFIPGQMVDKFEFQEKNAKVLAEGGEPATAKPVLLGVTRASLLTDSFLSAASFQETTRVLTQAAVSGAQDWLLGLKENVIIGRLIPARLSVPAMDRLLEPEPVPELELAAGRWLGMPGGPEREDFLMDRFGAQLAGQSNFGGPGDAALGAPDLNGQDDDTGGVAQETNGIPGVVTGEVSTGTPGLIQDYGVSDGGVGPAANEVADPAIAPPDDVVEDAAQP